MSSMNHDDWNRQTMEKGRPLGTGPSRQIEPGFYSVQSHTGDETVEAGRLFVEGDQSKGKLIEHWVLSEKHVSPRGSQRMVVEEDETESFDSLHQFLETMRERSRDWGTVTYIKATCEYFNGIPKE